MEAYLHAFYMTHTHKKKLIVPEVTTSWTKEQNYTTIAGQGEKGEKTGKVMKMWIRIEEEETGESFGSLHLLKETPQSYKILWLTGPSFPLKGLEKNPSLSFKQRHEVWWCEKNI